MKNLLNVLSQFCADHLLDEKIFIVPSYQTGHQIGEDLARSGSSWINLRFVTLPSLAMEVAGAELSAKGQSQISGTTIRLFILHIFRELKESGTLLYYGDLEAQTGIIDAISRSIRELRAAGIKSTDLKEDQFIGKDKGRETRFFLRRYEEVLEAGKLFDTAFLYEAASEITKKSNANPKKHFLCLQDQIFTKIEREFLESLTENLILVPHGEVVGMARPGRMLPVKVKESKATVPQSNLERVPWLFNLGKAPAPFKDNTIQMFQALGPTNECREIVRKIIGENIPFDQVEIICPRGSVYPSIFFILSEKMGFSFTSSEGLALGFTVPGKVFSGIIDWMDNDYPAKAFCSLVESEFIKTQKGEKETSLSPLRISRILKRAKIGWGRDRYVQRLDSLYEDIKERSDLSEDTDYLKAIRELTAWFQEITALFPSWDETERIDVGEICIGISSFLKKFCRIRNKRDGEALGIITSRLDETASFKDLSFSKDEAVEWLQSLTGNLGVGVSGPMPGSLYLSAFLSGGFSGRPYTFMAGLDQGAVPGSQLPDPILLDEEREAISGDLARTAARVRENLYLVTALLSSLKGKAVLSFSALDVIEERQSFPSSFLLQVLRLLKGNADLDYSALVAFLGNSSGFIPVSPVDLDETDWWLHFVAGDGFFKGALKSIKEIYPNISQGDYARGKREGPDLSTYDGIVSLGKSEFHPLYNTELRMSASRFETMAACPYRYFLRYVLDVLPPDEVVLDKARWLDGKQRGTILHDIFCGFMRRLRKRREILLAEKHRDEIRSVAEKIIVKFREENPPPSEVVFEREKTEIFATLDIFLRAEEKRSHTVDPLLFEANFGIEGEEGEGISESVQFGMGGNQTFRLYGRIDRIDALGSAHFRVVDYKTGSYTPYESIKSFGKGKYLQHALYAEAAECILKTLKIELLPRVSLSGYSFPTKKGDGREILIENFDRAKLRDLLKELFSFLENGQFLVNPEKNCGYCDYLEICGSDVIERTVEKKKFNEGTFAVFERLKEYE